MPIKDPAKRRAYDRDRRRQERALAESLRPTDDPANRPTGDLSTPARAPVPASYRLETAEQVRAMLEDQVNRVCADPAVRTPVCAKTVGFLGAILLRAIEVKDMAARLEALEAALLQLQKDAT